MVRKISIYVESLIFFYDDDQRFDYFKFSDTSMQLGVSDIVVGSVRRLM